jgi:hypothetical protein
MNLIERIDLIQKVKESVEQNKGFAMGKLGFSEQFLLGYLPFKATNPGEIQLKAYEAMLRYHCEFMFGIFPTDISFLHEFAQFYTKNVQQIDILGLFQADQEEKIIKENELNALFIPYQFTEPDRSIPSSEYNCYLRSFEGKKILFISPFADLLKSRANKDTFEAVWLNIGKKWFCPSEVNAYEIPYSYSNSFKTHEQYTNSMHLFDSICTNIGEMDFDIAFIGAGALGLPIASHLKNQGKIAISLGGHLQVLFGIGGGRWSKDEFWTNNYINEHWIEMPKKYHPENKSILTDNGAYW